MKDTLWDVICKAFKEKGVSLQDVMVFTHNGAWVSTNRCELQPYIEDKLSTNLEEYETEQELYEEVLDIVENGAAFAYDEVMKQYLKHVEDELSEQEDVQINGFSWTAYAVWESMTTDTDKRCMMNDWLDSKFKEDK